MELNNDDDGNNPAMDGNGDVMEQLPGAMNISDDERRWSQAIKTAAASPSTTGSKPTKEVSDFCFVQHAMQSRENVEEALQRLYGLEALREEYKIQDTVEEGMMYLRKLFHLQPGMILSVQHNETFGHVVLVYQSSAIFPGRLKDHDNWVNFICGVYYLFQSFSFDLRACREGLVEINETMGMSWDNFNITVERRIWDEIGANYPLMHKEISWLNTPLVANILFSMIKPFVNPEFSDKVELGCKFVGYDGPITALFEVPTPEIARENTLLRLHKYLTRRYNNERNFALS